MSAPPAGLRFDTIEILDMATGNSKAVVAAMIANAGIAVAKFVAFAMTGAASMLAEGVHSVADTGNQALLLWGGVAARRVPDKLRPFGYGRERYFWAFVVALCGTYNRNQFARPLHDAASFTGDIRNIYRKGGVPNCHIQQRQVEYRPDSPFECDSPNWRGGVSGRGHGLCAAGGDGDFESWAGHRPPQGQPASPKRTQVLSQDFHFGPGTATVYTRSAPNSTSFHAEPCTSPLLVVARAGSTAHSR